MPALIASRDGQLKNFDLRWYPDAALTVVMAAKGYPGDYEQGSVIGGLDAAAEVEGVEIFHAGTKAKDGKILANGGRVLNVSRDRQDRARGAGARLRGGRPDPLAGGLLPPRHRLAGGEAGEGLARSFVAVIARSSCDEAIQSSPRRSGLLRFARNEGLLRRPTPFPCRGRRHRLRAATNLPNPQCT